MKISTLIAELQEFQNEHGDLDCVTMNEFCMWQDVGLLTPAAKDADSDPGHYIRFSAPYDIVVLNP